MSKVAMRFFGCCLVQCIICFQSTTTSRKCSLEAPIALNPLWNQVIQRTSYYDLTERDQKYTFDQRLLWKPSA